MKPILTLLCFIFTILLSGCPSPDLLRSMSREHAQSYQPIGGKAEGYLVGSFSFHGKHPSEWVKKLGNDNIRYESYGFMFQGLDASNKDLKGNVGARGTLWTNSYENDFETDDNSSGYVFLIPLPPGTYEFYSIYFYNSGYTSTTWRSKPGLSARFTIEDGKATYIGQVMAEYLYGKSLIGLTVPAGGFIQIADSYGRDSYLLYEKYPFLKNMIIEKQLVDQALEDYYKQFK